MSALKLLNAFPAGALHGAGVLANTKASYAPSTSLIAFSKVKQAGKLNYMIGKDLKECLDCLRSIREDRRLTARCHLHALDQGCAKNYEGASPAPAMQVMRRIKYANS
mmetsp:Transcript_68932/g.151997  ORF Transcript_68932/g.151997 Transcript_68932/m.151997 type:complete len:108 (+) Transcript_68932:133-456(+)